MKSETLDPFSPKGQYFRGLWSSSEGPRLRVFGCLALALLAWLPSASPEARGAEAAPERLLTVVSLNLAMREDVDRIAAELSRHEVIRAADLVLLQEVVRRDGQADVASQLGQRLGFEATFQEASGETPRAMGLALLTRHGITEPQVLRLKHFDLNVRNRLRIALGAVVDTAHGPVQVYNVHLDTRINIAQRIEQLSAVTRELDTREGPAIVGGDFNTNDNRWLFHALPLPFLSRQRDSVRRFMEGRGFTSVLPPRRSTHDFLGMQLDWIFLRGLSAETASVQPLPISDHHAVIASLSRP